MFTTTELYQEHRKAGFKIRILTEEEEDEFEDFITKVLDNYKDDIT